MKVALINTPYLYVYGRMNTGHNCSFPLGLGYIASYIRQAGNHQPRLFDPEAERIAIDAMIRELIQWSPDLVGLTSVSSNYPTTRLMITQLRDAGLQVPIIYGGVHASAMPEQVLRENPSLDLVAVGEGEFTTLELLTALERGESDWSHIAGLCYLKEGRLVRTQRRSFHREVDDFPYPARDLVSLSNYRLHTHFDRGRPSATLLSSRGCPSSCTFCANLLTMGRRFRAHSVDYVIGEIRDLVANHGITHFHFVDDLFLYDLERTKEISRRIIAAGLRITWFIFGRVDTIDKETLQIMKEAGLVYILFGMESGNEDILHKIGKHTTLAQARHACKICDELGILTFNSFIIGNTGETHETAMDTIRFACELPSSFVFFNIMVPFVGTAIFSRFYRDLLPEINNWHAWTSMADTLSMTPRHTTLTQTELLKYVRLGYWRFYARPKQLWRIIRAIRTPGQAWAYMRGFLGLFRQMLAWGRSKE